MKIRDIQEYLRGRCPNRNIELLGTDDEPFLETAYAQEARVDTTIRDVASFASNSEEQLFYEFVQNAFDAHADSLCFYFDEKYLIVLNNGEPFYTDPRSKNPRDGQLYNFLVKNKSLKAGDKSKSGEFGQGSKLLYTLIPDKSLASNQTQLIKSIKGEKKGPYIISWKNREQLDAFRFLPAEWEFQDPHSGENDLLITKILMTYYPVSPGVDESLFSDREFEDIRSAFERLVDPKRNINRLSRGTAMIVPLGKGQYESISAKENLERVKIRLGGFASITSEKERNFGRHLDHIFVGQEEVELHSVRSVFVDFEVDGQEFSYQFAFNPVFAKDNYVNIFKTLPVLQAKYKFGFIIDSQNFDLDSSRQRINDTWKTSQQLGYAFPELLKKIKSIQKDNKELFDYIYLSLIKSAPYKDNADCKFICEPFYKTFTPFLQDNVKTSDGEYVPLDKVWKPIDGKAAFPLKELGITSLHWINEDLKKGELKRYGLDAEVYSLKEAIADADRESLKRWILSIGKDEYLKVHDELLDIVKEDEELQTLPLFRSNKCCAYSFKDVLSYNNTVFFFSEDEGHAHLDRCPDLEYILGPISYASQDRVSNNGTINVMKVSNNIGYFRGSDSRTDAACHILVASMDYIRAKEAIRTKIPLLKDFEDTYRPFCELFRESPAGTTVYDTFKAVGYVPDVLPSELFISDTEEIWDWTVDHQEDIYSLRDWDSQHMSYIRDLKKTYKAAGEPSTHLSLYLDENGIPQQEKSFSLHNSGKLSSEEYDMVSMFAETKGYHIVPQRFDEILKESPFDIEEVMMSDIIENGATVDSRLLHVIIKVYKEILYRFRIQSGDGGYFTVSRIASGRNYTCKVNCEESKGPLAEKGFYLIEDSVKRFFSQDFLDQFELTTQNNLMESALSAIDSEKVLTLLPIVRLHNDAINRQFFNRIHALDITKAIDTDDSRWEVITYALEKTDPYYRSRLLEIIRHNGNKLPSTIKSNKVSYNETTYDLYLLLGEVKEANELVESFLGCLPDGEYFRKRFYADNEETNSAEDVFNQLFDSCYLNVNQLEFCLDYAIGENSSYDNLEIAEDVSLSEALEMISRRRFNGFDRYFSIPEYERDVQVLADHKLLLDDEILPKGLESWLLKDTQNRFLMSGLMSSEESHIQIRKALSDDFFAVPGDFVRDSGKLARTTDWIIAQKYEMTYLSYRYENLSALVSAQPSGTSPLAVIRATGKSIKSESGEQHQVFTFCRMESDGAFMDHYNLFSHERTLTKYPQAMQFFTEHMVYEYRDIEFLNSHDLMGMPRFTLNTTAERKNYQEFLNELYAKWKLMPESEKVSIFTSDSPVSTMLSIVEGKDRKSVFELPTRNNLYGFDAEKKMVIIQHPNKENMSEMKTLAQAAKDIEFFKNPFIALQSLYVDMVESGMDPKEILGTASKKAEELVQKLGDNAVEQLAEKADVVKDLVENLTKEELQMVADNKDKLQNLLEDMSTDDEDTPESKVRKMIGYIGEQVYKLYLEKNGIDFEYSAEKGIGEYDFRIPGSPDTYLDVKTNLYTFVDAAVPFYIHKTQNKFMQLHPDAQYRIVRISLTDIRLKKEYEHIRDYFGQDADFELNDELRKRCEKIARDYWKGAKIQEFDAVSPEYGIRIERKTK